MKQEMNTFFCFFLGEQSRFFFFSFNFSDIDVWHFIVTGPGWLLGRSLLLLLCDCCGNRFGWVCVRTVHTSDALFRLLENRGDCLVDAWGMLCIGRVLFL